MDVTYIWLIAGVLLIIAEIFAAGFGLFFAGLGAIFTGIALQWGVIGVESAVMQWTLFFLATALLAALLWKPLQKFYRPSPGYSNIIGETAMVGSGGLSKHHGGDVSWSGTTMKARLAKNVHVEKLDAGTSVVVVEISGATLIVRPKE